MDAGKSAIRSAVRQVAAGFGGRLTSSHDLVSFVAGKLMTHCRLSRIIRKLWLPDEIIIPTSDGENSSTVCQPAS